MRGAHSHISVRESINPLAANLWRDGLGLWWAFLFLRNALAEGQALPGINRGCGALISVFISPGGNFQCPVVMPIGPKG